MGGGGDNGGKSIVGGGWVDQILLLLQQQQQHNRTQNICSSPPPPQADLRAAASKPCISCCISPASVVLRISLRLREVIVDIPSLRYRSIPPGENNSFKLTSFNADMSNTSAWGSFHGRPPGYLARSCCGEMMG